MQFMTFLDVVNSTLVFPPTGPGHWGHFHELGHNEQVGRTVQACAGALGWLLTQAQHSITWEAIRHNLPHYLMTTKLCGWSCIALMQLPEWTWEDTGEVTCNFFAARAQAAVRNNTDPRNFYGCVAPKMHQSNSTASVSDGHGQLGGISICAVQVLP
jgi:hypothetical protein